jgi:hypothetical protein
MCLTTVAAPSPPSGNVWARELSTGGYAMTFINTGGAAGDVVCDVACLNSIGFKVGNLFLFRFNLFNSTSVTWLVSSNRLLLLFFLFFSFFFFFFKLVVVHWKRQYPTLPSSDSHRCGW